MKKVIDDKLIFMRGMLTEIENEIESNHQEVGEEVNGILQQRKI